MFVAPAFRIEDTADLRAFIRARRFATLVVTGDNGPEAAHLPMLLVEQPDGGLMLEGHLRRAHPVGELAAMSGAALAIFHGADAYVTPSLYPSKAEHGKVVPTWNYVAVEARGALEVFADADGLRAHVESLTRQMESDLPAPWQVADAPPGYIGQMIASIVGVRLRVSALEGVRKLSQNRNETDRAAVLQGFAASPEASARLLAQDMTRLPDRPKRTP